MSCKYCKTEHNSKGEFCSKSCKDKTWYQNNKDKRKQYYIDNIEQIRQKDTVRYNSNKDKKKQYNKNYYCKNSEKIKLEKVTHRKQNRDSINKYNREYYKNVSHRLAKNLRGRLSCAIQRNFDGSRDGSFVKDLGCSIEEFRSFIEKKWTKGMSWDNYGWGNDKWHLDHIIALANFDLTNDTDFKKAVHYTNYQPLWQLDNFKKGAR